LPERLSCDNADCSVRIFEQEASIADVSFPFDVTGSAATNLVVGELHTLTEINAATYRTLIPTHAPFYLTNLLLEHVSTAGVSTPLNEGVDFYAVLPYMAAARSTGRAIYGGLSLISDLPQGTVKATYQTIGGTWTADADYVYARMLEAQYNRRGVYWDEITNIQDTFPPIEHVHTDSMALDGMTELLAMLEKVRAAILSAPNLAPATYVSHLISTGNVHNLSKEDLDLGSVQNLPMATDQEVLDGSPVNKYVTLRQILMLVRH
jgi:hypothetical protein